MVGSDPARGLNPAPCPRASTADRRRRSATSGTGIAIKGDVVVRLQTTLTAAPSWSSGPRAAPLEGYRPSVGRDALWGQAAARVSELTPSGQKYDMPPFGL
jgi:hypothetical protein